MNRNVHTICTCGAICAALVASSLTHAAEDRNPYVTAIRASQGTPGMVPPLPQEVSMRGFQTAAQENALPHSFVDNRTVFDNMDVVGRSDAFATLQYPSAQAGSFRTHTIKNGGALVVGGRSYIVILPKGGHSVQLSDKGKVIWEGDLSSPKISAASAAPVVQAPPGMGGVGIGGGNSQSGQIGIAR